MNLSTVDTKLMKALAHPLRQRILMELNQRVASPSELAEEIGEPLGNVSYHVRMLVDLDCIELVSTTPRRGALEHHYRASVRPLFDDATWASIPTATRRAVMSDVLKAIGQSVSAAGEAGCFDDEDAHVTAEPLSVDEQGRREIAELLSETRERAQEISAESLERTGGEKAQAVDTFLALMHYRAAEPRAQQAKGKRRRKAAAKS
jgi:DNA-binding transcriptional ArsR family regulator